MATDLEALDFFLGDFEPGGGPHSPLNLVIRDAEATMAAKTALWLATLGYLVAAEMIGRTIRKPGTAFPGRREEWQCFKAGMLEFADEPMSTEARQALWQLRCSLAHHWELYNVDHEGTVYRFLLGRTGPMWAEPDDLRPEHYVNVVEVGSYVSRLAESARREHRAGKVELVRDANKVLAGGMKLRAVPRLPT